LAAQKEEKDAAKKCQVRKALEQEALKKRRRQQRLDGLPLEESPSKTVSGEDDDSGDDDAWSRYDTVTSLAHLPNVRPFLEPIRGSTSQASREAPTLVEGEEELGDRRVGAGPAAREAASSRAPQEGSVASLP
jgi:ribosome biogenesis protein Tsr3